MTVRQRFMLFAIGSPIIILIGSHFWFPLVWLMFAIVPFIVMGVFDITQKKRSVLRLYPVVGRMRFFLESIRPEIQQYFVESDIDGSPVSREFRSLVYQRAKGQRDTRPFGTPFDVYRVGYEWLDHSMAPSDIKDHHPTVRFGEKNCSKPYDASPMNISAMSYGSLSKNAILALNKGAKLGGFAHNTGEGGITPHHQHYGGDIIWQIGTGYFGCRNDDATFNLEKFREKAQLDQIKMIEIKISQGAKPGHGGILPAAKVTQEIADIRHVPMGVDIVSPASHSAFSTPRELLDFIVQLREASGGKPVGFKFCVGRRYQFFALCKAMLETGITPDFITIDGGEGGTGAAPMEFANSMGEPLRDGLTFVNGALKGVGLRKDIRIIASGKVFSAFHILRAMALGADTVNCGRAMMFALGCLQAKQCHSGKCPTGVATQDPKRALALDVDIKAERVKRYQEDTLENLLELAAAAGLDNYLEVHPDLVNRRISSTETKTYAEIYNEVEDGCLLSPETVPANWKYPWEKATADSW